MTKNSIQCFIVSWLLLMSLSSVAQDFHFGVGGNVAYSTTHGISRIQYSNKGFSGDSFTVAPTIEHAIFGIVQYSINSRLEIEVGLGYANHKEDIYIYPSRFLTIPPPPDQIEKHLEINAYYLQLPIQVNWAIFQSSTKQVTRLNVGLNPKLMVKQESNFRQLIYENVGMPNGHLNPLLLMTELGVTQRIQLKNSHIDFSIFGAASLNSFSSATFGFLSNLADGRNLQAGLQMKYFFNLKNK